MVFPDSRVSRAKKASLAVWAKMEELGMMAETGKNWLKKALLSFWAKMEE